MQSSTAEAAVSAIPAAKYTLSYPGRPPRANLQAHRDLRNQSGQAVTRDPLTHRPLATYKHAEYYYCTPCCIRAPLGYNTIFEGDPRCRYTNVIMTPRKPSRPAAMYHMSHEPGGMSFTATSNGNKHQRPSNRNKHRPPSAKKTNGNMHQRPSNRNKHRPPSAKKTQKKKSPPSTKAILNYQKSPPSTKSNSQLYKKSPPSMKSILN